jgi:hypothetical protein
MIDTQVTDYLKTLWAVQATVVAFVYPIIISFVSVLLQKRPASKASLQIYLKNSRVQLAGGLSLLLVLVLSLVCLLTTSEYSEYVAWAVTTWFIVNSALTFWFLHYTLKFLHPVYQMKEVIQYVVDTAIPALYKQKLEEYNPSDSCCLIAYHKDHDVNCNEILIEFETNARTSAESGNIIAFKEDFDNLTNIHRAMLINASALKVTDIMTLAQTPVTHSFFSIHQSWANIYHSLFDAVISQLPKSKQASEILFNIAKILYDNELKNSHIEIQEELIYLPSLIMHKLGFWWVDKIEEQGIQHSQNELAILKPPLYSMYESILMRFVGSWESARNDIFPLPREAEKFSWPSLDLQALSIKHLHETGFMLLGAIARGDQVAAEWMADVLTKWPGYPEEYMHLSFKSDFITTSTMTHDWAIIEEEFGLNNLNEAMLRLYIFRTSIKNYWQDLCLTIIEILIFWALREDPSEQSLSIHIISGFFQDRIWRTGNHCDKYLATLSTQKYLTSIVRRLNKNNKEHHTQSLQSFLNKAWWPLYPDMVSGRVYSLDTICDESNLLESQLIILLLLSDSDWPLEISLINQLDQLASKHFQVIEQLTSKISEIKNCLSKDENLHEKLIVQLLQNINKPFNKKQRLNTAINGTDKLLKIISDIRDKKVTTAPISNLKLQKIAQAASKNNFLKETGPFPIQFFKQKISDNQYKSFGVVIQKLRKVEFTDLLGSQIPTANFAECIRNRVGDVLLNEVFGQCETISGVKKVKNAHEYWTILKIEAKKLSDLGLTPILIINRSIPSPWINDWLYSMHYNEVYPVPSDLVIRDCKRGSGYIADFNNIQVFHSSIANQSILLAREIFSTLMFNEYEKDTFIKADYALTPNSQTLIDLTLKFEYQIELNEPQEIIKICYEQ